MIAILILLVLALLLAGIVIARIPKRGLPQATHQFTFSERAAGGLFGTEASIALPDASARRQALLDRAAAGDHATLAQARAMRDAPLYNTLLDVLIERASSCQQDFDLLVRHVLENGGLPANAKLAERVLEQFKESPNRGRAAETVHLAALSDEAAIFERAVETILQLWSEGRLPEVSGEELRQLFESEYWVLGADARQAGPGFTLRRRLAEVRRQLAAATAPAPIQKPHESLPATVKEHSHE